MKLAAVDTGSCKTPFAKNTLVFMLNKFCIDMATIQST